MQGEQNKAWYILFAHVPFLLIISIPPRIVVYFCLLAERPLQGYTP